MYKSYCIIDISENGKLAYLTIDGKPESSPASFIDEELAADYLKHHYIPYRRYMIVPYYYAFS